MRIRLLKYLSFVVLFLLTVWIKHHLLSLPSICDENGEFLERLFFIYDKGIDTLFTSLPQFNYTSPGLTILYLPTLIFGKSFVAIRLYSLFLFFLANYYIYKFFSLWTTTPIVITILLLSFFDYALHGFSILFMGDNTFLFLIFGFLYYCSKKQFWPAIIFGFMAAYCRETALALSIFSLIILYNNKHLSLFKRISISLSPALAILIHHIYLKMAYGSFLMHSAWTEQHLLFGGSTKLILNNLSKTYGHIFTQSHIWILIIVLSTTYLTHIFFNNRNRAVLIKKLIISVAVLSPIFFLKKIYLSNLSAQWSLINILSIMAVATALVIIFELIKKNYSFPVLKQADDKKIFLGAIVFILIFVVLFSFHSKSINRYFFPLYPLIYYLLIRHEERMTSLILASAILFIASVNLKFDYHTPMIHEAKIHHHLVKYLEKNFQLNEERFLTVFPIQNVLTVPSLGYIRDRNFIMGNKSNFTLSIVHAWYRQDFYDEISSKTFQIATLPSGIRIFRRKKNPASP